MPIFFNGVYTIFLIYNIFLWLYTVNRNNLFEKQIFNDIILMMYMFRLTIIYTTLYFSIAN